MALVESIESVEIELIHGFRNQSYRKQFKPFKIHSLFAMADLKIHWDTDSQNRPEIKQNIYIFRNNITDTVLFPKK